MPREGGAPSKHRPGESEVAVITGSPAFAGDDDGEVGAPNTNPTPWAWGFVLRLDRTQDRGRRRVTFGPTSRGKAVPGVKMRAVPEPCLQTGRWFTSLFAGSHVLIWRMNLGLADALRRRLGPAMPLRPTLRWSTCGLAGLCDAAFDISCRPRRCSEEKSYFFFFFAFLAFFAFFAFFAMLPSKQLSGWRCR